MVSGVGDVEALRLRPFALKSTAIEAYGGVGAQPGDGDGDGSNPLVPSALTFNSALSPR